MFKRKRRINGEVIESREWFGALRMDWETRTRRWSLGSSDKREAERLLHAERVKTEKRHHGLIPSEEHADAQSRSLNELLEAFLADLRVLGRADGTIKKYRYVLVLFAHCGWKKIGDVTARSFCDWRKTSELAPRTQNALLKDTGTFFHWLRRQRMTSENPLEFVSLVETRRLEKYRRALTAKEVRKLISNSPHDRAVVYLLAVYTGLRRSEIGDLTVGDFVLDSPAPFVRVRASTAKNPKESQLRLRPEVVAAIRSVIPENATSELKVFPTVPRVRTLMKDLKHAGISFEDANGRRADFHALRDTFGTHLAAAGTAPFVLKELMRHSTVQQSEKYYIDARHLPLAAAVASLPAFAVPHVIVHQGVSA